MQRLSDADTEARPLRVGFLAGKITRAVDHVDGSMAALGVPPLERTEVVLSGLAAAVAVLVPPHFPLDFRAAVLRRLAKALQVEPTAPLPLTETEEPTWQA